MITISNIALMKLGGIPSCLTSLASETRFLSNNYKPVDFGYNNSEKADKKLFISFAIVFIIITI